MSKYRLLRESIINDPNLSNRVELKLPPAASDEELRLVHCENYLNALKNGTLDRRIERGIGFPYSPELLERSRRSVGATIAAGRAALSTGVAVNLAGGTHHAFRDRGEGFCVFNDTVVALKTLQKEGLVRRAIVIDTDVHQGNGTAHLLSDDPSIFTFSIHGAKNYPFRKEVSDLDVALPDDTQDREYLEALTQSLDQLQTVVADLAIFQSGADPLDNDKLGRLSLSVEGLRRRDDLVLQWCAARELPVAVTMGGGYAPDVQEIVEVHLGTVHAAAQVVEVYSRSRKASSAS